MASYRAFIDFLIARGLFRRYSTKISPVPDKNPHLQFSRSKERMHEESYFWRKEREQLKALKEKLESEDSKANKQTNK